MLELTPLDEGNDAALVVAEMAEEKNLPPTEGYEILDDRGYGDTRVAMLKAAPSP